MNPSAAQRVTQDLHFLRPVKSYILVNPTDDWILIEYGGEYFRIPPYDAVIKKHHKFPDEMFHSAVIGDHYVPGTLVVWDKVERVAGGGQRHVWFCEEAIREKLSIKETSPGVFEYTGQYGARGVSVVLHDSTKEDIEEARDGGRKRWKQWKIVECLQIISAHESRNNARRQRGEKEIPESAGVRQAREIVEIMDQATRDAYMRKFDLVPPGPVPDAAPTLPSVDELREALLSDPTFREELRAELSKDEEPDKPKPVVGAKKKATKKE